MTLRWDAAAYERAADPQFRWALEVLDWRAWSGDERVLDAGCGPGRVAEELLARLPRGQVVALDRDPDMLEKARARLSGEPRATVVAGDLGALPPPDALGGAFDAAISTAVLHWVPDHAAAFAGLHRLLRPGGELLLQCGGAGNIETLHRVAAEVAHGPPFIGAFDGWQPPWRFETAEATAERLRQAGFAEVATALEPRRPRFEDRAAFLAFCVSAPLRPHLQRLAEAAAEAPEEGKAPPVADAHKAFLQAVGDAWEAQGLPWELDYVRLNARARRAPE